MCGVTEALVASAIIGTGVAVYNGEQSRKAASQGRQEAKQAAASQAKAADEAQNRANAKAPQIAALAAANAEAASGGAASTMLTGAKGVDQSKLLLGGKNMLLGAA